MFTLFSSFAQLVYLVRPHFVRVYVQIYVHIKSYSHFFIQPIDLLHFTNSIIITLWRSF